MFYFYFLSFVSYSFLFLCKQKWTSLEGFESYLRDVRHMKCHLVSKNITGYMLITNIFLNAIEIAE